MSMITRNCSEVTAMINQEHRISTIDRMIKIFALLEVGIGVLCGLIVLKYLMVGLPYFVELMKLMTGVQP